MDGNVSKTDFLIDMSDYIDTNHPNVNLQDIQGNTVMSFTMKCDSGALTNIILERGYIFRSCDIKQAISENLSRDLLWILVRSSKLKQSCGSELAQIVAQYQDVLILDLLFDIGITFPENELHILFRAWDRKYRVQTGLKLRIVEQRDRMPKSWSTMVKFLETGEADFLIGMCQIT